MELEPQVRGWSLGEDRLCSRNRQRWYYYGVIYPSANEPNQGSRPPIPGTSSIALVSRPAGRRGATFRAAARLARESRHSRFTVRDESPTTPAVSSTLRPAKKQLDDARRPLVDRGQLRQDGVERVVEQALDH